MPNLNWKTATLGGMQFWTDHRCVAGCRLQQNELTKHWRVLDAKNVRQAWGELPDCLAAFEALIGKLTPLPNLERVVVLLHGLMRTPRSMRRLKAYLANKMQVETVAPGYASTRASFADLAAAFRSVIETLPGHPQIDLVAHSMGNIVIRYAINDWMTNGDPQQVLPRLHRMVMLGPPNQGALIARRLAKTGIFGMITGQGGLQLGRDWDQLESHLATPPFPFAIVAGKLASSIPQNPLVEGASDFVVRVEETHLDGATQEVEVPVLHSFLMDAEEVQKFIVDFLRAV